ncbi:MAG: YidC/Oxa1 family membrane protein insertase, partial [Petrotogales bacterium]
GGFLWISNTVTEKIVENGAEIERVIAGLAAPDQLFGEIAGYSIGILPILVGASMYFQQKLTTPAAPATNKGSSSANPTASTQKMMTTIMPLMIGFISFTLPSGLSLYWFTSTLFGIGQQLLINKKETVPERIKETIEEKTEKEEKVEEKQQKDIKTAIIEEEVPWIPGYENPASQQNKKNNKKGKPKKKKV